MEGEGPSAWVWTGSLGEGVREGSREERRRPGKAPILKLWLGLREEVTRVRAGGGWAGWVQGPERREADRLKRVFLRCV